LLASSFFGCLAKGKKFLKSIYIPLYKIVSPLPD